jgi:hypothetical protein
VSAAELTRALGPLLERYRGQRLVGVIECSTCVEVVFSGRRRGNLLSLWLGAEAARVGGHGRFHVGDMLVAYAHGSVVTPEQYYARARCDGAAGVPAERPA